MESPFYILYFNLKNISQAFEAGGGTAPSAVHAVSALPSELMAGMSLQVRTAIYEDQVNADFLDLTGATTLKMYAMPAGYVGSPIELATGTLVGVTPASGQALFQVVAGAILDAWSTYDYVRIYWEIGVGTAKIFLYQDVTIVSMTYFPDAEYPESSEIPTTYVDLDADGGISPAEGLQIIRIDTTAADVTAALHASAAAAGGGEIIVLHEKGANDAKVSINAADTAGINGHTTTITLGGIGKGLHLFPNSNGDGWINENCDVVVVA